MQRCVELAGNGLGTTYPNPLVGSVIVFDGRIIGEGWHRAAGEPHAEVLAIASVRDRKLLSKSTLYVNLEPCSHFGKTPPCADLILKNKIPNVVIGTIDPHSVVCGNGIQKLISGGVNVVVGILESECNKLNKRFFTFHHKKRPYIILKWAESWDGFIAPDAKFSREPIWISNVYSRQLVHKWRTEENAILVGTNTVEADNPRLTVRDWCGKNPIRIVIDRQNRLLKESHIFDDQARTIVIGATNSDDEDARQIDFNKNVAQEICDKLYAENISSVIIEGGRQTLQTFIDANLWDEARVFRGNAKLNSGISRPKFEHFESREMEIGDDKLLIFENHDQHHNI